MSGIPDRYNLERAGTMVTIDFDFKTKKNQTLMHLYNRLLFPMTEKVLSIAKIAGDERALLLC